MSSNLKDTITNYCAIAISIGVALIGLPALFQQFGVVITIPSFVQVIGGILAAAGTIITSVLTGKLPNGSAKTPEQVQDANSGK